MSRVRFVHVDMTTQPTPAVGKTIIGYDVDGVLKQKDSDGVITVIGGGGASAESADGVAFFRTTFDPSGFGGWKDWYNYGGTGGQAGLVSYGAHLGTCHARFAWQTEQDAYSYHEEDLSVSRTIHDVWLDTIAPTVAFGSFSVEYTCTVLPEMAFTGFYAWNQMYATMRGLGKYTRGDFPAPNYVDPNFYLWADGWTAMALNLAKAWGFVLNPVDDRVLWHGSTSLNTYKQPSKGVAMQSYKSMFDTSDSGYPVTPCTGYYEIEDSALVYDMYDSVRQITTGAVKSADYNCFEKHDYRAMMVHHIFDNPIVEYRAFLVRPFGVDAFNLRGPSAEYVQSDWKVVFEYVYNGRTAPRYVEYDGPAPMPGSKTEFFLNDIPMVGGNAVPKLIRAFMKHRTLPLRGPASDILIVRNAFKRTGISYYEPAKTGSHAK